ncbi:formate dehydrogenase accessory protein FdhE [Gordonibacter urolithinfaciens]|uniref:Formate dehydrogenase accessory protein FdhE n=4 Tax=Gordonibacter urolithinfaciens TaxID=1335613 RepID=A0A6N8IJX7_9ACTN|nr:formate dehydrogenase accessory protein FdhE [Gordonibacter urolithinfaciens]MVN16022.1 formate dehydrogenase accessory protein FdhE [Gordonibacter urolithinfaciens]MVN39396.1 formate dehydrogenase accessory protein FdhE [Gordonibacter urolithinfaciens]MVN62767.1 formate dehydrogenase accessory protein FdhE [Gordonibacter urolithinfaciens]
MNLKAIDAALAAYREKLDEGETARLAFFRKLWGALDEAAADAPAAEGWDAPCVEDLRTWFAAGEPVLAHAPATVGAAPFAAALGRAAACAAEHGGFAAGTAEALGRTRWDRIVAASPLGLAGSDPAAYLDALAELLADDGMTEDQARTAALVAALALRSQLEEPARAAARALGQAGCDAPHPLACPVCGGAPAAGRVGGENSTQGRGKTLWCAQCGTSWEIERVRCARCGTQNQAHLHYYNVEGDDAHRIATCDECGGYLRTVYADDALAPFSFEVEDVVMARLDAIAAERG